VRHVEGQAQHVADRQQVGARVDVRRDVVRRLRLEERQQRAQGLVRWWLRRVR
jgi:hypothetical protein